MESRTAKSFKNKMKIQFRIYWESFTDRTGGITLFGYVNILVPEHKDVKKELPNNQEGVQNANEDGSKQEDAFKGWEIVLLITFPLFAVGSVCLEVMKVLKSFSRCIITTGFYHGEFNNLFFFF